MNATRKSLTTLAAAAALAGGVGLAIAQSGIVFVPGGPGTLQEVFQDGAQNAYETYGAACPMVFLDHPHDPGWWERSGVLVTLDGTFVDEWGRSRAGRDLVVAAASVDSVLEVLLRYRDAPRSPLSLRSTTSTRGGAS